MTCDPLPSFDFGAPAGPAWTLWYRPPGRPDRWRLRGTGPEAEVLGGMAVALRQSPGCEWLVLPPGETPCGRKAVA